MRGFEYLFILRNGKLQNVEEYFSNLSNRRMKSKFHFLFGRFGLQDLFDLVVSVTDLLYTLDLPRFTFLRLRNSDPNLHLPLDSWWQMKVF